MELKFSFTIFNSEGKVIDNIQSGYLSVGDAFCQKDRYMLVQDSKGKSEWAIPKRVYSDDYVWVYIEPQYYAKDLPPAIQALMLLTE